MNKAVLLDTGPLVAVLNSRDRYHKWAQTQWHQMAGPLLTCEAVLSEACFLLSDMPLGVDAILQMLQRKVIVISFRLDDHIQPVSKLLKKYSDVPISLADACLVRMSEQYSNHSVFTMDGDFNIYRRNGRQVISTIMPAN